MADITLAELQDRVWLVGGEDRLDDLLANTLPPGITTEIVPCAAMEEVMDLWVRHCGPPRRTGDPWLINPAIVKRIRGSVADHAVAFPPWSALLDEAAEAVIQAAATLALSHPDLPVTLVEYRDEAAGRAIADLQQLRLMLIEERLTAHRIAASRIRRRTRGVDPAKESQRIDILVREESE